MRAPIALFVYDRLWHTKETISALSRNYGAAESDLYVFSDAAKSNGAVEGVEQVREYIQGINGFRSVSVVKRSTNFGLAGSVIDGVTELVRTCGSIIVMEDDLITSPHFLEFMNDGLIRYADEAQVMQIAGYMFPGELNCVDDALFLPFISSWGWATWDRAWKSFDADGAAFAALAGSRDLRRRFDLNGRYGYFKMLKNQRGGRANSWAIRWYLSVFMNNGLALHPRKSMVRNIGFDGSGVNCSVSEMRQEALEAGFRVSTFPREIEVSSHASEVIDNIPKARIKLSSALSRFRRLLVRQ